ncbi:MAG: structural protein P5 [Bacteroidota bacterium]
MSRGLTNKNPLNIRKTSGLPFLGEITSTDASFKQFESIEWGYRAGFVLLNNYIANGYNTITKIINRWAPPVENNTSAYVSSVAVRSGLNKDIVLSQNDSRLIPIVAAMSFVENGVTAIADDVKAGFDLMPLKKK